MRATVARTFLMTVRYVAVPSTLDMQVDESHDSIILSVDTDDEPFV